MTFQPRDTVKKITVPVNGDTSVEPDESFFVRLLRFEPQDPGFLIATSQQQGVGTIVNDDFHQPPTVTPVISGTLGDNGWYVSNVSVEFNIDLHGVPLDSSSGCDEVTLNTDTGGTTFTCTVTTAGGTASVPVTVKLDATAPTASATLSGPLGDNGWYTGAVTASWTLSDDVSGVATSCPDETSAAEGTALSFSCTAKDNAGNSATASSPQYKLDATAPTVTYAGNTGSYGLLDVIAITCSADDNLSGVANNTCTDVMGPAYDFESGTNSFSATATDFAGNVGSGSTSFSVVVAYDDLCSLVERWVSHEGVANALCKKLEAAARANARGNTSARNGSLGAFINQVEAQSGKKVPADKAPILILFATKLM